MIVMLENDAGSDMLTLKRSKAEVKTEFVPKSVRITSDS